MKTIKAKIDHLLTSSDKMKLWSLSYDRAMLYNIALNYAKENGFDYKQMHEAAKNLRNELKLTSYSKMSQNTVIRLINNWKSYLSLRKSDETARAPSKFASTWNFQPLMYDWNNGGGGFKLREDGIFISMPKMNIRLPKYAIEKLREYEFQVKTMTFSMQDDEFYVSFCVDGGVSSPSTEFARWLSVDPGLSSIISLVTCDGIAVKYRNHQFKKLERSCSHIQSKLDKKKKYSNRFKRLKTLFKKKKRKVSNKNRDFQHKVTKDVINFAKENQIDHIIYGDIQTKQLTKSKAASTGLNKSTQNRGSLGRTKQFLQYKSGLNGIRFSLQNEAWTSKTNYLTGEIFENITLETREVRLLEDLVIDRDINGAINIAQIHLGSWLPQEEWLRSVTTSQRYVFN